MIILRMVTLRLMVIMMSTMRRKVTKRERMTSVMMIMATMLVKMRRLDVKGRMYITRIAPAAIRRAMIMMKKVKSMKSPMTATAFSWEWKGGSKSYKKE